jgi:hypothetical protein
MRSFADRAEEVLAKVFDGCHKAPKVNKYKVGTEFEVWEVNTHLDLSTYDPDRLTRLVVAAHNYCVRATVRHSGPGLVKIQLWPRNRHGNRCNRHPKLIDWSP